MKKLFVAFAVLILALSLAACGGNADVDQEEAVTEEAVTEEAETEETVRETGHNPPTAEELQKVAEDEEIYTEEEKEGEYCLIAHQGGVVYGNKAKKYGAVNAGGDLIIPCEYDYMSEYSFDAGGRNYTRYFVKRDGAYGLLDETGEAIIPWEYSFIDRGLTGEREHYPGRVLVAKKEKDGPEIYLSAIDGKQVDKEEYENAEEEMRTADEERDRELDTGWTIPSEGVGIERYDSIGLFSEEKKGKKALFSKSGQKLTDYKYTYVWDAADNRYSYHFLYDHLLVRDEKGGSKYGLVDESGREIAPCGSYTAVEEIGDGLIAVQKEEGGLFALAKVEGGSVVVVTDHLFNTVHQTC